MREGDEKVLEVGREEGGRGGRKWDEREKEREREKGRGERAERREVEAENLIGRDACERRKETVDQTSRASEASVWNEDVSISRQIEQHASRSSHFYYRLRTVPTLDACRFEYGRHS